MRKMWLILLSALFVLSFTVQAEEVEKYTLVELNVDHNEIHLLQQLGLPLDCCMQDTGKEEGKHIFQVPLNSYELGILQQHRLSHTVVVEDMAKFYEDRNKAEATTAVEQREFKLGSVGGFYSISELSQALDSLYETHKSKGIINKRVSIGKTYEGRDIFMVKISDNAASEESEQGVLITAMHHAREPQGMMTVVYFMQYLLENYPNDARVKNIVDNRQIYFVPMINVDGYAYNCSTNPSGGGMWRKNRNGSGTDLNRNYGPQEYWNYPNNGSSTSSGSDTYRGPSAFSEPETRVIRDFVLNNKLTIALNYHTYSNLLIYPLGIKDQVAHPMYTEMATKMTQKNGYRYGTAPELLYPVRGVSDDWMHYRDGSKSTVFAMTPEVGGSGDGFWPSRSRILPLAQENLEMNLLLTEYAAKVPTVE